MGRKTYMKDVYSKYCSYAREKEYGFLEYDKNISIIGAPWRIRTSDPRFRKPMLYPAELRALSCQS